MTKNEIIKAVSDNGGKAQVRSIRPSGISEPTLRALSKAGYSWRSCGGWLAVAAPGLRPDEPGQHIQEANWALIDAVLKTMVEPSRAGSYWDLYWAVKRATNDHFKSCEPFDSAIRFAVRHGLIEKADWMKFIL